MAGGLDRCIVKEACFVTLGSLFLATDEPTAVLKKIRKGSKDNEKKR